MQSFKDVSNLILKGLGLRSYDVEGIKSFAPVIQSGMDEKNSIFINLIEAVKNKDKTAICKYLSDQDIKLLFEVSCQTKDSLLHFACLSGDVEILKLLKELYDKSDAEKPISWVELINGKNSLEQTPLHWSCTIENLSLLDFLNKEGADLNVADSKGVTPLIMCSQYGNTSCSTYLILNSVNVFTCDGEGDNALHWALYKGNPELSRLMIYSGLNPNQKDGFCQTPLHFACLSGNENCVQNLVETDKVELNVYDNNNKTPLMLAAGRRQNKIVNYLKFHIRSRAFKLPFYLKLKTRIFGTPFNSHIPMLFFVLSAMLWGNPYYFLVIRPCSIDSAFYSNVIFVFVQCLMWLCFLMTTTKDPGFVTKNDSHYSKMMNESCPMENFQNIKIKDCYNSINKVCHSCRSYKPVRTRHCRTCDRCVDEMDHHCPYVNNCIGKNNRSCFLLFIAMMDIAMVVIAYLFYITLSTTTVSRFPAAITCILILFGIFLGFTIFFFMFKQALNNLTLIETQKWKRYNYLQDAMGQFRNPFYKGYINNLLFFFNLKFNDVLQ